MPQKQRSKVWLIRWERIGEHVNLPEPEIAAILSPRISGERIRELVELMYMNACFTLSERARYALRKKENPYPARFGSLDGVPWTGMVECGHNPYLLARLAYLTVELDKHGHEAATWEDCAVPKVSD
jgi:hypothetical protein